MTDAFTARWREKTHTLLHRVSVAMAHFFDGPDADQPDPDRGEPHYDLDDETLIGRGITLFRQHPWFVWFGGLLLPFGAAAAMGTFESATGVDGLSTVFKGDTFEPVLWAAAVSGFGICAAAICLNPKITTGQKVLYVVLTPIAMSIATFAAAALTIIAIGWLYFMDWVL